MPSAWVEHIRDFAKRNNLTYGCALSDPKCSEEYRIKFPKPAKKGKKGKKLDLSKTEFVPLEEAEMDTEPKTKMVVEKKPPRPLTEEKKTLNLKDKWKVGDEFLYGGSLYIVRRVTPTRLFLQADIPVIENSKKEGENIVETGRYPREFKGVKTSFGGKAVYSHVKLPKNYDYKYKSYKSPTRYITRTTKGKGIQLNRDMVMKMVGAGLSC
jgi:hypothetical protein